jgi:hypothetical protein
MKTLVKLPQYWQISTIKIAFLEKKFCNNAKMSAGNH